MGVSIPNPITLTLTFPLTLTLTFMEFDPQVVPGNELWYAETVMQVIASAPFAVSDHVLFRVIQVISNAADTHVPVSLRALAGLVGAKYVHDTCLCLYGYILGEVGFNISSNAGQSGYDQFAALHKHYGGANSRAKVCTCILHTRHAPFLSALTHYQNPRKNHRGFC